MSNVLDTATVAKRYRDDLIAHAGLGLRGKKLTPGYRECPHVVKRPNAKEMSCGERKSVLPAW
jgi:hypothetical protein